MGGELGQAAFVGRVPELARLETLLREATDGRPRLAIVAGEAGVGKTRLVETFVEAHRGDDVHVIEGACLQLGSAGTPYAPVVALLRSLARSVEPGALAAILGPGRAALSRLVPEFLERAPASPPEPADATSQIRLFELVAGAIERLARSAPLVAIVEDVHWSDASSRELLDFLVRGLGGDERLLLILTLRTDALGADEATRTWVAELSRLPMAQRLDLGPLAAADVEALVSVLLGGPPEPALAERIIERAGGNPFLTEELTAAGGRGDTMPDHLRELLLARLVPLGEASRGIVRAAAAGGRRVDDGLLAAALELDEPTVHAALRQAVANGLLIRGDGGRSGKGGVVFRHALLREAIEDELFPDERARLHAAYARALEARSEEAPAAVQPAELAAHWDVAGEPERALPAYVRAARLATRVYAWPEARRSYERALALWDEVDDPEMAAGISRADILLETADVCGLQGAYPRAVELARAAVPLVDPSVDPHRAADVRESLRWFLWEAGDRRAAAAEVAEALRITPPEPPTAARARALAHAAGLAMFDGRPTEALALAEEAVAVARAATALPEEALALGIAGWAVATLGDTDAGVERFRAAMSIARILGSVEGIALGYTNLTGVLDRAGRATEALAVALDGVAEVERFGLARTFGAPLLADAARTLYHLGRWDDAERTLARATTLATLPRARLVVSLAAGRLAAARGRFDEAERALETAADIERTLGAAEYASALAQACVELAAWSGWTDAGRRAIDLAIQRPLADPVPDPALAWVAALGLRIEADVAEVARARRDAAALETARRRAAAIERWLRAAAPVLRRMVAAGTVGAGLPPDRRIRGIVDLCRAERQRLRGRPRPAVWAEVAEEWTTLERPLVVGYARYREAAASQAGSDGRDAARHALGEAARIADDLGAVPLAEAVARLARAARLDLDPGRALTNGPAETAVARDADGLGLTHREREVLRHVAAGWSNPEIAEALGITAKTASVHVSNILGKLGASSRVEAAVLATRIGLGPEAEGVGGARSGRDGPARVRRTFMFTDIVRSAALVDAIGDRAWSDLRRWHDRTLRAAFSRHRGVEIDHPGDGFFVAFPAAADAVACAIQIQRRLAEHRRAAGFAPGLRIGIHAGEAEQVGAGYGGSAVHVAARIAARAGAGEILASAATAHEARVPSTGRPAEARLAGDAEARLAGDAEPIPIVELAW